MDFCKARVSMIRRQLAFIQHMFQKLVCFLCLAFRCIGLDLAA